MNPSPWQNERRLVPRWRSLKATLYSRELASPLAPGRGGASPMAVSTDMLARLERWQISPSLVSAAELVEACIVEGREENAIEAARRLVAIDKTAAPLIRDQAVRLLSKLGKSHELPEEVRAVETPVQNPRHFTRIHSRDPLGWVELALHQTVHGAPQAAERSMKVALGLSPQNRHVLRSAARLFLHLDDPERALELISRNSATKADPWLMASEIALAQVVRKSPRFAKVGSLLLARSDMSPREITELAGAIATEELVSGNRKKARRAFSQSLQDPTGNALAQGEWAASSFGAELIAESQLSKAYENAEAMAFHAVRFKRYDRAPEFCEIWAENDPFSIRPFEFGAAVAGYVENFEKSIELSERGLKLRPAAPSLLNALAFAAASLGEIDRAVYALDRFRMSDADHRQKLIFSANQGLLAFRIGQLEVGRRRYLESIDGFRQAGDLELSARARIYLAREAMLAGCSDWPQLLKEARAAMSKHRDSDGHVSLAIIEARAKTIHDNPPPRASQSQNDGNKLKEAVASVSVRFRL